MFPAMPARTIFLMATMIAWLFQPPAPWFGVWRLNPEKSETSGDRYKRVSLKIEPWQDRVRVTYDLVGTRGGITHMEWIGSFDGKDYPVQGVDYVLTNAYTLIDNRSYRIVLKVDGVPAATARVEISPDGKTMTSVTTEEGAQGESVTSTSVYDKSF
jgi:hypothetical protein